MTTPNLGWLFYKKLYDTQSTEKIKVNDKEKDAHFSFDYLKTQDRMLSDDSTKVMKKRSQQFFTKKLAEYKPESFFKYDVVDNSFELTTTYPGLLCGVGYNHGISSEADYKVGFYFDHTTGLPIIPGSSVKGVLRSAFPGFLKEDEDNKTKKANKKERYDFFRWLIGEVNRKEKTSIPLFNDLEIDQLEAFIFEGQDKDGNQISYYKRDRFFDAYPVKSLGHDGCFLKNDYITPHIDRVNPEMSPFKNPTPLQFLKVLPKVQFLFQFKLTNDGGLKADQKELLFKEIFCFFGIGAKTNVGYGQFEEGFQDHTAEGIKAEVRTEPQNYTGRIRDGEGPVEAKVIDQNNKKVKMIIKGIACTCEMAVRNCPLKDSLVLVEIKTVNKKNEILMVGFLKEIK